MNYRHAFHAGNFADLVKHAALTLTLGALADKRAPLTVIDTHAGAGIYDLGSDMAARTGESAVAKLVADPAAPPAFAALKAAIRRRNRGAGARFYPGSAVLIAESLTPRDKLLACELRGDDHGLLRKALAPYPQARTTRTDGYVAALRETPFSGRALVHIDPPFEADDDYARAAEAAAGVRRRNPNAVVMIWTPLKDLETFDAFLRKLEDRRVGPMLVAQTRLRPLSDPTKMNGSAIVIVGPPPGVAEPLRAACEWAVVKLGEAGGAAVVSSPAR